MTYIPDGLRRQVIARAEQRCEYCLIHQHDSLYTHEVDHIIPVKHRGETTADNLCLACLECNRHKGSDFWFLRPRNRSDYRIVPSAPAGVGRSLQIRRGTHHPTITRRARDRFCLESQ